MPLAKIPLVEVGPYSQIILAVSTASLISAMPESLRAELNHLRHLLQHIPDSVPLPQQQSEIIYPFVDYAIDEEWLANIESEGVVNLKKVL